jgi:hypothetical protein
VLARLSELILSANVTPLDPKSNELRAPNYSQVQFKPDGSFRIAGLQPGKVQIALGSWPPQKNFTIIRIEHNGVEVRDALEVGAGEQVTGVRIRIAYGAGMLRGQVELRSDGAPAFLPPGGRLRVSAQRVGSPVSRWGNDSVEVDERGRFMFDGLSAGDYELTLSGWVASAPGMPHTATFPTQKQTVTVSDNADITLTLLYDLSAKKPETKP